VGVHRLQSNQPGGDRSLLPMRTTSVMTPLASGLIGWLLLWVIACVIAWHMLRKQAKG
jgi:hypothetical protein